MGRVRLVVVVLLLAFSATLNAVSWEVGFIGVDRTGSGHDTLEEISALCKNYFTMLPVDAHVRSVVQTRLNRNQRNALLREAGGVASTIELPPQTEEQLDSPLTVTWHTVQSSVALADAVAAGDIIVGHYLTLANDLDELVVVSLDNLDTFQRLNIKRYIAQGTEMELLFDRIAGAEELDKLIIQSLFALAPHFFGREAGALAVNSSVPLTSVHLNGEAVAHWDMIVVPAGSYELSASAFGYEDVQVRCEVRANEICVVEPVFIEKEGSPLLITSRFGQAGIMIDGEEHAMPFLLEQHKTPFAYEAKKEGYRTVIDHVPEGEKHLSISWRPLFLEPQTTIPRAQEAFYHSLARTLLGGALTIAIDSLGHASSNVQSWQPFVIAAAGVTAVSLADTIIRLFAYYQKTQYSSQ